MAFRRAAWIVCALAMWHATSSEDCRDARAIPAEQDEPLSVTCTMRGAHRLSWRLGPLWGAKKNVGSCQLSGESACQVTGGDRYVLTRQEPYTSTLTIAPSTQPIRPTDVECTGTKLENGAETKLGSQDCWLLPVYPADKFKNCGLQWNSTDWTVSGFCEVDSLNKTDWDIMRWDHYISAGEVSFREPQTKPLGNHKVRGELRGLPMDTARRSGDIDVTIWDEGYDGVFVARFPVEKPGDPELHNCPSCVTEGSNLTCRCRPSSSKPGTPRPVVTWTPKQAGDNQLHISNIQRESDNQTFTCYQYWGGWSDSDVRTVSYTVHVYHSEGYPDTSSAESTTTDDEYHHPRPTTQSAEEKDDYPTVLVIACGLEGAVIVLLIIVIIVKRRRGSEGNTAHRMVGTQTADDHQVPRERRPPSQDSEGYTEVRGAEPLTSDDGYLEPRPRRLETADSEGYTDARSAESHTSDYGEYIQPMSRRPPSADVYQGLQMNVVGQKSIYTQLRPGNRRRPNE